MTIFEVSNMMFNCLDQYWSALGSPGNPGMVGFYRTFMQTIHSMCDYRHPVWAVSHAGHCAPPDSMDMVEGKCHFLFIFRVHLLFFSNREVYHNRNCKKKKKKLQLPLIVIWYICLLYKAGLFSQYGNATHPLTPHTYTTVIVYIKTSPTLNHFQSFLPP